MYNELDLLLDCNSEIMACLNCKEIKELSYFSKDKNRKNNRYPVCKACKSIIHHRDYVQNTFIKSLYTIIHKCKKTGMECDIDKEYMQNLWTGRCELTGIEFKQLKGTINPYSPTIDRINNDKGYLKGNVRFVLYGVNAMKNIGTDEDVYKIAEALVRNKK